MVGAAGSLVKPAPTDALLEHSIGNMELDDSVHSLIRLSEQGVEGLCLLDRARKAIKDEAFSAIALLGPVLDDADDDLVGYQPAALHHFGCFLSHFRAGCDSLPQHVSGGEARRAHLLHNLWRLCSLACTGGAKEDQDCTSERGVNLRPDLVHILVGIHADHIGLWTVVVQNWLRLVVVALQALSQGLCVVIGSLHQRFARLIVQHVLNRGLPAREGLRRRELDMVGAARSLVKPTPTYALFEDSIGNMELDHPAHSLARLGQHLV